MKWIILDTGVKAGLTGLNKPKSKRPAKLSKVCKHSDGNSNIRIEGAFHWLTVHADLTSQSVSQSVTL